MDQAIRDAAPRPSETVYLALVHIPAQAVHGFAVLNLALAATAVAAAAMAVMSVRRR